MERKELLAIMASIIGTQKEISEFDNWPFVAVHRACEIIEEIEKLSLNPPREEP